MRRSGSDLTKEDSLARDGNRTRNDMILILIIAVIALGLLFARKATMHKGDQLIVTVDQETYGTYPLNKNKKIVITQGDMKNILIIKGGKAEMVEANCPDKICVHHKAISQDGETIVCLPHKVVARVKTGQDGQSSTERKIDSISR